jgi:hypothetical protein
VRQGSLPSFDLYFQRLELDLISLETFVFVAFIVAKKEKVSCFLLPIHLMSKYSYFLFVFVASLLKIKKQLMMFLGFLHQ